MNEDKKTQAEELFACIDKLGGLIAGMEESEFLDPDYVYEYLNGKLSNEAFANLILQRFSPIEAAKSEKQMALDVAEVLGPDWAQRLYRFTVLVTKLA